MSKPIRFMPILIVLACLSFAATAFADVKVKSRQTAGGQTFEITTYIKGKRQRNEQDISSFKTVNLTQCDLKRSVQIIPQSQAYMINSWTLGDNGDGAENDAQTATSARGKQQKGGVITSIYTTKDTGERKQMFGYTARHLIVTMETESSPDACNQQKIKMQIDGWYIDAAFALDCGNDQYANYQPKSSKPGCQDRYVMKQIGTAKQGYPVWQKTIIFDDSGKETTSFINEVVELSNATLDAALFDVPAGYREVKSTQELYASIAQSSARDTDDEESSSISKMANNRVANVSTQAGAKKVGVVRLGLASVEVGAGLDETELAAAIRNSLAEHLKAPNMELVQLESAQPSAIDAEAKQKGCDFVVYTNASHKKGSGSGFGKVFGGVIAPTAIIGRSGSTTGNIKAKDELTLAYKLMPAGGASPAISNTLKAKAKADGEDIVSTLTEQAAQAIVNAASKK